MHFWEKYPELQLMIDNPSVTTTQIADILQKHRITIQRRITKLKEMGIVTRSESDKSGCGNYSPKMTVLTEKIKKEALV